MYLKHMIRKQKKKEWERRNALNYHVHKYFQLYSIILRMKKRADKTKSLKEFADVMIEIDKREDEANDKYNKIINEVKKLKWIVSLGIISGEAGSS